MLPILSHGQMGGLQVLLGTPAFRSFACNKEEMLSWEGSIQVIRKPREGLEERTGEAAVGTKKTR